MIAASAPPTDDERLRLWLSYLVAGRGSLGDVDDAFAGMLLRRRLAPLAVFHGARHALLDGVERRAFVSGVAGENTARRTLDILADAGVPAVCHKGPPLAVLAWGDPTLRACVDVDLLLPGQHLARALRALEAEGVTAASPYPRWYERLWHAHVAVRGAGSPTVELHHNFTRPWLARFDFADLAREAREVSCAAQTLPSPSPAWQLVLVAAHATQHFFDVRGLLDMALLGTKLSDDEWRQAHDIARRTGVGPALVLAVSVSAGWLDWRPPAFVGASEVGEVRRRIVRAYAARYAPTDPLRRGRLQFGKLVAPMATASGWRWLPAVLMALTDRPNVATAVDARWRAQRGATRR